jgi:Ca2+-binding EF-hand superfamily protein
MRSYILPIFAAALGFFLLVGLAQAQTISMQPDWKERFRAYDRNGDGRIDRGEYQEWMVEVFYSRDRDRKGYLVAQDLQGVMSREKFGAANRKGDGKLTLEEMLNTLFQDFDVADTDRTGSLSIQEIEIYIRRPN